MADDINDKTISRTNASEGRLRYYEERAYDMAQAHAKKIKKLEKELYNPSWAKDILKSNLIVNNYIKWIILIFSIIITLSIIIFIL